MQDSLFSPLWYRVSERRVRLRPQVQARLQRHRGQAWYVLASAISGRQYRINKQGYQFIGRCDGERTVQEVWDSVLEALGDDALTQDEVIGLLSELNREELLYYDASPDIPEIFRRQTQRGQSRLRGFVNPLAFRVPLGDPSKLLDRLGALGRLAFQAAACWLWAAAMLIAVLVAAMHWQELRVHAISYLVSPRYLLLAWVVFPVVKFFHEMAHALAVRRWGGEVHEMGVTFLVLVPAPYVDASAAAGFRERRARVIVGAAGMMVELLIAAVALAGWLTTQPGLVRDIAFVTMFVSGVSALLFNANPLMRFDGYYIACDALDLPNLAARSRAYWLQMLERLLQGVSGSSAIEPAPGEKKWLIAYAPLSLLTAIVIAAMVVLWVGSTSVLLGALAAIVVTLMLIVVPLVSLTRRLVFDGAVGRSRWRAAAFLAGAAIALSAALLLVPVPFQSVAWGVIWVPEHAHVRAETEGFIRELPVRDGERVAAGQVLVMLEDPVLQPARSRLLSRLDGLQSEHYHALLRDPHQAQNILQDIERTTEELKRIDDRINALQVRGQVAGALVMPRQADMRDTFARKGHLLGYVLDDSIARVRAAVPEDDAALVRSRTHSVEVRLAEAPGRIWRAAVVMDTPASTRELPSSALGDRGGGVHVTDPSDKHGLRALQPIVLIDVELPDVIPRHIGARAWVRFDHGSMPVLQQSYRQLRLLFLRHFNPND